VQARDVGRCIIDDTTARLRDFHAAFLDGEAMQGLLDVLSFASKSRGDTDAELHDLLSGLVTRWVSTFCPPSAHPLPTFCPPPAHLLPTSCPPSAHLLPFSALLLPTSFSSTEAELARRVAAHSATSASSAAAAATSSTTTTEALYHTLACAQAMQAEAGGPDSHARALGSHLPHAAEVASAALYASCGASLTPWLRSLGALDPAALQVLHAARATDRAIGAPVSAAAAASDSAEPGLAAFARWDLEGPLAPVRETETHYRPCHWSPLSFLWAGAH
jgi:hypothetical protein